MTRMQSELEAYAKENQDLKAAARQETHVLSKQRTTTDRAVKDSVLLKKRVDELEPKLIAEEVRTQSLLLCRLLSVCSPCGCAVIALG